MSPEAVGTAGAALIASLTGVGAYLSARRSKRADDALAARAQRNSDAINDAKQTAELTAAQVEGWTTLIESLNAQFQAASLEASELRTRLGEGNDRFDAVTEELRVLKRELVRAHECIADLEARIEVLRAEVVRLGGDVDEINRVGKHGPRGEKGPRGDKGPPA